MTPSVRTAVLAVGVALSFAAHASMLVVLSGRVPAAALACAYGLGAVLVAAASHRAPLATIRCLASRARLRAALGGILMLAGPVAVCLVRRSDAPSGSETVFFTTAAWACIAALPALWHGRGGRGAPRSAVMAGAFAVLVGAAGVVANWERPSSFSPLVKFPAEEAVMLLGGAAFVIGGLMLSRLSARDREGGVLVGAVAGLTASAIWAALARVDVAASFAEQPVAVVLAAAAWGFVAWAWPRMTSEHGDARAAAVIGVAPVLVSLLTVVELAAGVSGPQPLLVAPVLAGAAMTAAGAVALWSGGRAAPLAPRWHLLCLLPAACALTGLASPALLASVSADRADRLLEFTWTLPGYAGVAGLAAVALAGLLWAAAGSGGRALPCVGLVACAGWRLLADTPLRTLSSAVPASVQQDYGTEFASITFTAVADPALSVAVWACAAGFAALLVVGTVRARTDRGGPDIGSRESEG